jgi:3',5'-cyclic AMP phosphodiesterase CpdA
MHELKIAVILGLLGLLGLVAAQQVPPGVVAPHPLAQPASTALLPAGACTPPIQVLSSGWHVWCSSEASSLVHYNASSPISAWQHSGHVAIPGGGSAVAQAAIFDGNRTVALFYSAAGNVRLAISTTGPTGSFTAQALPIISGNTTAKLQIRALLIAKRRHLYVMSYEPQQQPTVNLYFPGNAYASWLPPYTRYLQNPVATVPQNGHQDLQLQLFFGPDNVLHMLLAGQHLVNGFNDGIQFELLQLPSNSSDRVQPGLVPVAASGTPGTTQNQHPPEFFVVPGAGSGSGSSSATIHAAAWRGVAMYAAPTGHKPWGIHLALAEPPAQLKVMWSTYNDSSAAGPSAVMLRASGTAPNYAKSAETPAPVAVFNGSTGRFVDGGKKQAAQWLHNVTLTGLVPGQRYEYRVGAGPAAAAAAAAAANATGSGGEYWSGKWIPLVFRSSLASPASASASTSDSTPSASAAAAAAASAAAPLKIVAIADLGHNANDNGGTIAGILEAEIESDPSAPPDVLLHAGDLAYDFHTDDGSVGDRFMVDMERVASRVPWMVAPGNHEAEYNFSHYRNRFSMPQQQSTENLFWSLDLPHPNGAGVHVIAYNTEAYFAPYCPTCRANDTMRRQFEWLEADLKRANEPAARARIPWIVVMGHRPYYCNVATPRNESSGAPRHCDGEQEQSRLGPGVNRSSTSSPGSSAGGGGSGGTVTEYPFSVERLMYDYGVDLALFGHVHDYSRFFPTFNLTVLNGTTAPGKPYTNPRATVHMTIGGAGNPEMPPPLPKQLPPPAPPTPALTATCKEDRGCRHPWAPWAACETGYYPACSDMNYGRIVVANATHLRWQQVSVTQGGEVIDGFWLVVDGAGGGRKGHHGPFSGGTS